MKKLVQILLTALCALVCTPLTYANNRLEGLKLYYQISGGIATEQPLILKSLDGIHFSTVDTFRWLDDGTEGDWSYYLEDYRNPQSPIHYSYSNDVATFIPETEYSDNWTVSDDISYFKISGCNSGTRYLVKVTLTDDKTHIKSFIIEKAEGSVAPTNQTFSQPKENGNYTLDFRIKVWLTDAQRNRRCGSVTVKDALKYLIIHTNDEATAMCLNVATAMSLNGKTIQPLKLVKTEEEYYYANEKFIIKGHWYFRVEFPDGLKSSNDGISITWHNVTPQFNTWADKDKHLYQWDSDGKNLVISENKGYNISVSWEPDIKYCADWDRVTSIIASGTAGTSVVAPNATMNATIGIQPSERELSYNHIDNLSHPSGSRLTAFDNEGNPDFENPVIAAPVKFTRFNEAVAKVTINPLKVAEEVTNDYKTNYRLYVMPENLTINDIDLNDKKYFYEIKNANATAEIELTLRDIALPDLSDLAEGTTGAAMDGYGKRIMVSNVANKIRLNTYVLTEYTLGDRTFVVGYDSSPSTITLSATDLKAPAVYLNKNYYHNYLAEYYHNGADKDGNPDDWGDTKPGKGKLGWFAYSTSEFSYKLDDTDLNAYAAFHFPQQVMYHEDHRGCYPHHNPGGSEGLQRPWYMFQFAGTRAANGGAVMNFAEGDINPLEGYTPHDGTAPWADSWTDSNDWSSLAVESGRLPIQINPAHYYGDEVSGKPTGTISGHIAAVYPVAIGGDGIKATIHTANATKNTDTQSATPAKAPETEVADKLLLFEAKTPATIYLSTAQIQTGVEQTAADADEADTPVEYYNLQGIRVANPAKGQVYIMRRGGKASKVLMK